MSSVLWKFEYAFIIKKSSQWGWLTSTYDKRTAQEVSFPLAANVFDNIKKNFHRFKVSTHKKVLFTWRDGTHPTSGVKIDNHSFH